MSGVKIVAFNADGYQKVIATFDRQQVRMVDSRIELDDPVICETSGGVGVVIDPAKFPEMVKFVVTEWRRPNDR